MQRTLPLPPGELRSASHLLDLPKVDLHIHCKEDEVPSKTSEVRQFVTFAVTLTRRS